MPVVKTGNINWISNLRLIALYAVIVLHCTSPLLAQYGKVPLSDWWTADFLNSITRFAVPVFVMITGVLLLHKDYELGGFLKKRLGRVVIPFLFWSLVYIWYSSFNEEFTFSNNVWTNIDIVIRYLKIGSAYHLWYVYMLIGLYFFIPIIAKYVRNANETEILYFLVLWFAVMMLNQPYVVRLKSAVDVHYFAGFSGYLVLGHYLAYKEFQVKNLRLWMMLLFLFSLGCIIFGTWFLMKHKTWPGTTFYEPLNPLVLMLSASVFMLVKLTVPKVSPAIIRIRDFAGSYNYGIYLAHALVLYFLDDPFDIIYKVLSKFFNDPFGIIHKLCASIVRYLFNGKIPFDFSISYKLCTPIVSIPLTALICFVLSLLLVWGISKIPFVGTRISG